MPVLLSTVGRASLCVLAIGLAMSQPRAAPGPVTTTTELVSGTSGSVQGVTAYFGIPYAAPPTGDRRWRPPPPAAAWEGARPATAFGTSCQQQARSRLPWTEEYMTQNAIGEDCLSVNVWTPTARGPRPLAVMVWIHGATSLAALRALPADTFIAPKGGKGNAGPPSVPRAAGAPVIGAGRRG